MKISPDPEIWDRSNFEPKRVREIIPHPKFRQTNFRPWMEIFSILQNFFSHVNVSISVLNQLASIWDWMILGCWGVALIFPQWRRICFLLIMRPDVGSRCCCLSRRPHTGARSSRLAGNYETAAIKLLTAKLAWHDNYGGVGAVGAD